MLVMLSKHNEMRKMGYSKLPHFLLLFLLVERFSQQLEFAKRYRLWTCCTLHHTIKKHGKYSPTLPLYYSVGRTLYKIIMDCHVSLLFDRAAICHYL